MFDKLFSLYICGWFTMKTGRLLNAYNASSQWQHLGRKYQIRHQAVEEKYPDSVMPPGDQ